METKETLTDLIVASQRDRLATTLHIPLVICAGPPASNCERRRLLLAAFERSIVAEPDLS
jgi:hypothetical protein